MPDPTTKVLEYERQQSKRPGRWPWHRLILLAILLAAAHFILFINIAHLGWQWLGHLGVYLKQGLAFPLSLFSESNWPIFPFALNSLLWGFAFARGIQWVASRDREFWWNPKSKRVLAWSAATGILACLTIAWAAGRPWPYRYTTTVTLTVWPESGAYRSLDLTATGSELRRGEETYQPLPPIHQLAAEVTLLTGKRSRLEIVSSPDEGSIHHPLAKVVDSIDPFDEDATVNWLKDLGVQAEKEVLATEISTALDFLKTVRPGNGVSHVTSIGQRSYGWRGGFPRVDRSDPQNSETKAHWLVGGTAVIWLIIWAAGATYFLAPSRDGRPSILARARALFLRWPGRGHSTTPVSARTATVMFTDLKDYTARTSRESRENLIQLIRDQRQLVESVVGPRGGQIVKSIGDALLIVFESATDAVLAGLDIQERLMRHNRSIGSAGEPIQLRIAVSTGEVSVESDDIYGEPVNLASRVQQLAAPGDVLFTGATLAVLKKSEVRLDELGLHDLKGFDEKIAVYRAAPIPVAPSIAGQA